MYGNVAEFPSTVLNDIASENHEQATKEMQKKEAQAQNVCLHLTFVSIFILFCFLYLLVLIYLQKKHQEEWDMRNERLEALKGQVMVYLKSNIENVTQLFQSCQNAKATITVVPDKLSTLGGIVPSIYSLTSCSSSFSLSFFFSSFLCNFFFFFFLLFLLCLLFPYTYKFSRTRDVTKTLRSTINSVAPSRPSYIRGHLPLYPRRIIKCYSLCYSKLHLSFFTHAGYNLEAYVFGMRRGVKGGKPLAYHLTGSSKDDERVSDYTHANARSKSNTSGRSQ